MYSVFEDKIKTNMGRHLVRKYEKIYDAQRVYMELRNHAKQSTHASLEASNILEYITTVKLHKIAWKGSYKGFILNWNDKLRIYEDMVSYEDHFTNNVKKTLLENVVMGVPILRNVKIQAEHDRVHGKGRLSYDEYFNLLLSAADTYDAETQFKRRNKLQAYNTYSDYHQEPYIHHYNANFTEYDEEEEEFNIDTNYDEGHNIQEVYRASYQPSRENNEMKPRIPK